MLSNCDPQKSAEAAHTYVQESKQLHNSLNTWPSKTLERDTEEYLSVEKKVKIETLSLSLSLTHARTEIISFLNWQPRIVLQTPIPS